MISLDKAYNRESFVKFLEDNFLPEDFHRDYEKISLSGSQNFASEACRLGECKSLELEVFEVQHNSLNDARVGIAKDAFRMLLNHSYCNRALVAFVPGDGKQWRFSLLQMDADLSENNRIKRSYSNPRRYSFLLGESSAIKTPTQFLIEKGRIRDRQEGTKKLNPWEDLLYRFSIEALTKQFYNDLFEWYLWAISEDSNITFPNNPNTEDDDRDNIETKIIRLITRLMFVWFIKQKTLVPDKLFDEDYLKTILIDFDSQSQTVGNYYNAILQNLFFATLNRAIEDEDGQKRRFAELKGKRDIKSLYRYAELFSISKNEVIDLFSDVPFMNGGLFECLDKTKYIDGVEQSYNDDGFSRNDIRFADGRYRHRAVVPNILFFKPEKGLLEILKRYNFTIEENTPAEQTVALDPELLGKVFENLLGAYNPETKETARNQSGSFYTPREIVSYMVDESLIAYLGDTPLVRSMFKDDFEPDELHWSDYQLIAGKLKSIKVLDPACGSGAFPMGLLNRIVDLLKKIETDKSTYDLKLNIIENCIYGCDIQSIATQITKLRFFISLICDCDKDINNPNNFGIPTLPNLETKFVTADTLIGIKDKGKAVQGNLFIDTQISELKEQLREVRHEHFRAKTAGEKVRLRKRDENLRMELVELLSQGFQSGFNAEQLTSWNPYDQNSVSHFFDAEWMFDVKDGFDIVIGNPPYIQLQNNNGALAELYESCGFETFTRTGDIYCLFYERGHQLLKQNGHLCYITSNKWMRAGYGEKTRQFFATKTDPQLLVDFAGVKIFESATVDTNILLFQKTTNKKHTICAVTKSKDKDNIKELSDFVRQISSKCNFSTSDSWVILSPIEQSIKNKIEAVGTPLKDWNINIYRGVLTGCNEAFIISGEKREEILQNCVTGEEKKRTAELIRPILRGRDIKRYGYEWANLWLIYIPWHFPYQFDDSIQGASEMAEQAFKEQYPSVYQHMTKFKEPLSKRNTAETGIRYEWYAMQRWGAKYWDDFNQPKIIYPNMTKYLPFVFDTKSFITNQKCFIVTGKNLAFLTAFLNSSLFKYCFRDSFPELQGGTRELSKIFFDKIPIYQPDAKTELLFVELVEDIQNQYSDTKAKFIDKKIFDLYGLNDEERKQIGFVEIL